MPTTSNRRRLLAAGCLAALALFFLTNPFTRILVRGVATSDVMIALRGFAAPLHMVLLIGSVFGIMQILRVRADSAGLIGGTLTLMGWTAGVRILGLGQLESLLASGGTDVPPNTLGALLGAAPLVHVSIVHMGILFPIGLITMGATIAVTGVIPRPIGVILAVGGFLFPVGRIGSLAWAFHSCDLLLGAAFALIAWQVATRSELWDDGRPA